MSERELYDEETARNVAKMDELFADCCDKLRTLASARFMLTGELPPIPETSLSPWFKLTKGSTD